MNETVGAVAICIGVVMFLLARPRKGEDVRPFVDNAFVFAVYPAAILLFLALGAMLILAGA
ncbi:hypothetical protein [Microvirga lenta]|uniref:hypothetical protein n=1 Tax=Microvirga lenta TaxID=2881337 RepID=UPI001CFF23EC|nr:hypothetical protein [Microvirga lenta]MCB5173625.1 hypothetical protein [Microvirga lenta]